MSDLFSVVAVVDHRDEVPVVWWVNAGHKYAGMSRMCGAWDLTTPDLRKHLADLVQGYTVVATTPGAALLDAQGIHVKQFCDLERTRVAVSDEVYQLEAAYQREATTRKGGKTLVSPAWPDLPGSIAIDNPNPTSTGTTTARAFDIACWLRRLCDRWDTVESQRIMRTYLRALGGEKARPLPLALLDQVIASD